LFCLYHRRPAIAGLYGGLAMRDGNIVDAQGCAIKLTPMQQQLMEMFMSAPEYTLSKQQICDALWPKKDDASETLYTLIRRLKPIIEQHSELKIEVDRGRAYQLKIR
jgi:DNA-binding response OmpR family regulator